jgi:putative PIN family toxin of toxin-antitoxin system
MAKRKKVKRFVVDVNAFISIFIAGHTEWLLHYVIQNNLEIFIDDNLLNELLRVLEYKHIASRLKGSKFEYLNFVRYISTQIESETFDIHSPDPEDDYLYNIALTANAKILVTNENALLHWKESPVETLTLAEFRYYF